MELDVAGDRVERFTKEGGSYVRLLDRADPLDRGGNITLAHGDLQAEQAECLGVCPRGTSRNET